MERLTAFFILFVVPFFIVGCAVKKQSSSVRAPASIASPLTTEADSFMEEIENAPSTKY
jgi:hypothetical protein